MCQKIARLPGTIEAVDDDNDNDLEMIGTSSGAATSTKPAKEAKGELVIPDP